jgi:hypothetical protein
LALVGAIAYVHRSAEWTGIDTGPKGLAVSPELFERLGGVEAGLVPWDLVLCTRPQPFPGSIRPCRHQVLVMIERLPVLRSLPAKQPCGAAVPRHDVGGGEQELTVERR